MLEVSSGSLSMFKSIQAFSPPKPDSQALKHLASLYFGKHPFGALGDFSVQGKRLLVMLFSVWHRSVLASQILFTLAGGSGFVFSSGLLQGCRLGNKNLKGQAGDIHSVHPS